MHIEGSPVYVLSEGLHKPKRFPLKMSINLVSGASLRPILTFLDQQLSIHAKVMKVENIHCHAKKLLSMETTFPVLWVGSVMSHMSVEVLVYFRPVFALFPSYSMGMQTSLSHPLAYPSPPAA